MAKKTAAIPTGLSGGEIESRPERSLPEKLAGKYALVEGFPMVFACEFGEVDISNIDEALAERLADKGYLTRLDQSDPDQVS